jgi:hypothetical protein
MSGDMWGVFFEHQGVDTYLVEAYEDEEEAQEAARRLDEVAFDEAVEKHANEPDEFAEPVWEDYEGYEGSTYVDPIARTVVEDVQGQLDRGFAVKMG